MNYALAMAVACLFRLTNFFSHCLSIFSTMQVFHAIESYFFTLPVSRIFPFFICNVCVLFTLICSYVSPK